MSSTPGESQGAEHLGLLTTGGLPPWLAFSTFLWGSACGLLPARADQEAWSHLAAMGPVTCGRKPWNTQVYCVTLGKALSLSGPQFSLL